MLEEDNNPSLNSFMSSTLAKEQQKRNRSLSLQQKKTVNAMLKCISRHDKEWVKCLGEYGYGILKILRESSAFTNEIKYKLIDIKGSQISEYRIRKNLRILEHWKFIRSEMEYHHLEHKKYPLRLKRYYITDYGIELKDILDRRIANLQNLAKERGRPELMKYALLGHLRQVERLIEEEIRKHTTKS